jgi:hypothetical protein
MANFLNRMAARAIGVAQVAQPFVPAMFAPGAGLARHDPSASGLEPEVASVEVAGDPAGKTRAPESAIESTLPRERNQAGQEFSPRAVSWDSTISSPAASLPASETLSAVERQDRLPLSRATAPITQPAPLPTAPDTSPYLQPEVIRPYPADVSAAVSFEPDQKPLPETDQLIAGEPAIAPRMRQPDRPASSTLQLGPTMPANSRTMYSRRDQTRGAEPEGPVIRISIGRIDVRAQFSAATSSPAPARNARPAPLSLDEYLKQRREGKR